MKKLAVLFFACVLSTTTIFANKEDDRKKDEIKVLRTQIVALIGDYSSDETIKAEVSFMINTNGEFIVLDVKSNDENIGKYVKATLNYKAVESKSAMRMKVFKLPLTIEKSVI